MVAVLAKFLFGILSVVSTRAIALSVVVAAGSLAYAADAEEATSPEKGERKLRVGTVDFLAGKCGCPTVMVRNRRQAAVLILATQLDEPLAALARSLQAEVLAERDVHAYLVRLAPKSHRPKDVETALNNELQAFHTAHKLDSFTSGLRRSSGPALLKRNSIPAETAYAVFLLDADVVRAEWLFSQAELTVEQTRTIVRSAQAVFQERSR